MKKILAILVAVLLLCSSAFAEAIVPEEITVELDETYVEVALGEEYACANLPADWLAIDAEYSDESGELLGAFASADGTSMLIVAYVESDTATSYEEIYSQSIEAGLAANLAIINGYEFVNIAAMVEDQVTLICTTFADEECTAGVIFTFSFPAADAEAMEVICNQVLGSFDYYVTEA